MEKLPKLHRDLTYFKLQLEGETNRQRNILILTQIKEITTKINEINREEKDRLQREIRFMREQLTKRGTLPEEKRPDKPTKP